MRCGVEHGQIRGWINLTHLVFVVSASIEQGPKVIASLGYISAPSTTLEVGSLQLSCPSTFHYRVSTTVYFTWSPIQWTQVTHVYIRPSFFTHDTTNYDIVTTVVLYYIRIFVISINQLNLLIIGHC